MSGVLASALRWVAQGCVGKPTLRLLVSPFFRSVLPTGRGPAFQDWPRDRSGSVVVVVALAMPVLLGAVAIGVDVASLYLERRTLQSAADAAALAAAADPARSRQLVQAIFAAYGQGDATVTVHSGRYAANATVDRDSRFVDDKDGKAIDIEASRRSGVFFIHLFRNEDIVLTVRAQASLSATVSLGVGSRLATLDPTLVNGLTRSLTGSSFNLTAMDHTQLLRAQIETGRLLGAVAAATLTNNGAGATVGQVLVQPLQVSALLNIAAGQLQGSGNPTGGAVLRKAAASGIAMQTHVRLDQILKFDPEAERLSVDRPGSPLNSTVSAFGLLYATIRPTTIGGNASLYMALPGIASVSTALGVGEAAKITPPMTVGKDRPSVSTDQMRLRLHVKTSDALAALGVGVDLPVELVMAGGTAEVISTRCNGEKPHEVRVLAHPGLFRLSVGTWTKPQAQASVHDTLGPAPIVDAALASVDAGSNIAIRQRGGTELVFTEAEIGNGTIKTAKTTLSLDSAVRTLLSTTRVEVRLKVIGVSATPLEQVVATALSGLFQPIDEIIAAIGGLAGLTVGELDVRVDSLSCGQSRIVG